MRANPYPQLRWLREHDPVHVHPHAGVVFVTRHADCRRVLRDPAFRSHLAQGLRSNAAALPATMLSVDGEEHDRLRSPARRALAAAAIRQLRPPLARAVADALDALRGRGMADLLADFAEPVTLEAIGTLLDVPGGERPRVRAWLDAATPTLDPLAAGALAESARVAAGELREYVARRMAVGSSRLLRDLRAAPDLAAEEAADLCTLLAVGGFAPTVHLVGNALRALLDEPIALARFRAQPALIRTGVEELLRFDSPIPFAARVPESDRVIGGHLVPAGQPVVCLLHAANRDPAAFPEPDRLRLDRRPNPHLGFGAGAHFCLGAALARLVATEAIPAVLRAFPALARSADPWSWRGGAVPHGLDALPVRLTTRRRRRRRCDVLVIGAGMAGLACAADVARRGRTAVVLEARDRVGGRVATSWPGGARGSPVELGAQVVHGRRGSLWPLLRSLRVRVAPRPPVGDVRVVLGERRLSAMDLIRAGVVPPWVLAERLAAAPLGDLPVGALLVRFASGSAEAQLARDWIAQAWCADPGDLSAAGLRMMAQAQRRRGAGEFVVLDGYDAVPRRLAAGLDVRLAHPVWDIAWSDTGVEARTSEGTFAARAAVVTTSPTAVAGGSPRFSPELPPAKRRAAANLRLGDAFVIVARSPVPAPTSTWALVSGVRASFWEARAGSRRITGWSKGPAARATAGAPLDAAASAFEWLDAGDLEVVATADWGADRFAGGGYSYPRAQHLAVSSAWVRGIGGVLHFAGEATAAGREAPLVDTAIDSGRRAARRAVAALS